MPPRYDHAYTIGFSLISNHPEGEDVTPQMLREAICIRLKDIYDSEILEACGAPFDSFPVENEG